MNQWTDVENFLDLIDHIWIGFVLIACAAVPAFFSARNHQGIKKIQDQVVNGHKDAPPLRQDLDKVIEKLSETSDKVDSIGRSVDGLRAEISREELARRESDRELRDDIDRRFSEVVQRIIK